MTHGDKAKAKTGKGSSQTSGKKVSKAVETKASGKEGKGGKGSKAAGSKQQAGSEKAAAPKKGNAPAAKDVTPAAGSDAKAKARGAAHPSESSGFSNAVVGSAFKHALKKYPNAFRRLTD